MNSEILGKPVDEDESLWPLNHGRRIEGEQWILLNRRVALLASCLMKSIELSEDRHLLQGVDSDLRTIISASASEEKRVRGE